MDSPGFVHLRVHTEYSMVDGLVRVKPLISKVAKLNMPAVAISDVNNLFALVKFYQAAQRAGIKPIVGADLFLKNEAESGAPSRITLICQNRQGYSNLTNLISLAYIEGQDQGTPQLESSWLHDHAEGLILLSGFSDGPLAHTLLEGNITEASRMCAYWQKLFPNRFYLEVQRTGRVQEETLLHETVSLAEKMCLPIVATNDVRFLHREDYDAHEVRVCIYQGKTLADPRRSRSYSEQQYLRSVEEMQQLFDDIPEALQNSVEIAKRCNLELNLGEYYLPEFPIPGEHTTESYFCQLAREGLEQRLLEIAEDAHEVPPQPEYHARLEEELQVIMEMGFPGYFLIVADFIRWAKENGIPVGPGRGSGAGSLVAYSLGITDLDPLAYDLLFERFLNPERVSLPDFDVDFCMEGRDRVIEYVAQTYGRDKVSQIITYGSMAAKAVVRDVGRVLGHPYGFVDKLAKLIPFELNITLEKALEQEPELQARYHNEGEVQELIDMARQLEGLTRNAGKHAGGVVIAPSKLTDFTPLYCEAGGNNLVTQLDKDDVEAVGLVKFDFLGLRTLTIIDWAIQSINVKRKHFDQPPVDIDHISLGDAEVYRLLQACNTTAVFQLESRGMKDLIRRLKPDTFEDIVALVALFRPGPLQSGMVDDFIDRKHGKAKVLYPHPDLEQILKSTYGVILYQEQVMQIAQVLANYTLGAADILRRAMGKKKPEEMAKQREIFLAGATERQVDRETAEFIFDLMEKFAGYGFNKSHSAAYALVSYQTAWLKTHYPADFMAAVLSADMDNTDKIVMLINDCAEQDLDIIPPCVNRSEYKFAADGDNKIVYGLGAIKGVGESVVTALVQDRSTHGPYKDLFELCARTVGLKTNKRVFEALIRSGSLDCFDVERSVLMATLPAALRAAEQAERNRQLGQSDLFGGGTSAAETGPNVEYTIVSPWSQRVKLQHEKESLGLFLSGHPLEQYEGELNHFITTKLGGLDPRIHSKVLVAGLVIAIRKMETKRGERMAFVTLQDQGAQSEVAVFADVLERDQKYLRQGEILVVQGELNPARDNSVRLSALSLMDLTNARERYADKLALILKKEGQSRAILDSLKQLLVTYQGGSCPVVIQYMKQDCETSVPLGPDWRVHPEDLLLESLHELLGPDRVQLEYSRNLPH